ncbi:MAG: hypothetical protein JW937_07485 [Candidatus Omnitrophica bacterium]|nr:hypothetical protein [Candidatus Omnitrophota bacterium]
MNPTLYELADAYIKIIEQIERTSGLRYKDRQHVTRIAYRIVKDEL